MAQGAQYEVTVTSTTRKAPVLRYRGPVPRVGGLAVQRNGDQLHLVYTDESDPTNGGGVVLDIAKDPGGELELVRAELGEDGKPSGRPVTKTA